MDYYPVSERELINNLHCIIFNTKGRLHNNRPFVFWKFIILTSRIFATQVFTKTYPEII